MTTKIINIDAESQMTVRKFQAELLGLSPLSFSRHHETPKLTAKEAPADWEKRTWREKLHWTDEGEIFIPPMAFKNGISEAARFLNLKIPGKRNATYTKHFERGVICDKPALLGIHKNDVISETLFVPSDGKRGGGNRVPRTFPVIPKWKTTLSFDVWADTITDDVLVRVFKEFGYFIGVGRFRPQNNGYYGRFQIEKLTFEGEAV